MAFKNLRLDSDTSRLILLFAAILPATESKDWLFYTVSVLIIGLFIMHVIYGIKQLCRQEKYFLCIMGNLRSELIDLMVDIAGLMVAYSMDYTGYIRFWVVHDCYYAGWDSASTETEKSKERIIA